MSSPRISFRQSSRTLKQATSENPCHPPREEGRKEGEEERNEEGGEVILPPSTTFGEALEAEIKFRENFPPVCKVPYGTIMVP